MEALPVPVRDPSAIARLQRLLNMPDQNDFMLTVAWMVAALHPDGPFPVLALDGEHGSAKSSATKMIRRLVDPNRSDARRPPKNEDDLIITARNSRVIGVDNVSNIDPDMADGICRVATGGGLGKRGLYTDGEEVVYNVKRPVLLNGIPAQLGRPDLADRAVAITLPHIPDDRRLTEKRVWREFDTIAPGVFAALLDALVLVVRDGGTIALPRLPRMADFAQRACAAAAAFGWTANEMLGAIEDNARGVVELALDHNPVAQRVLALAEGGVWRGTASQLLSHLNLGVAFEGRGENGWPKNAAQLSNSLKRCAPALRAAGVTVTLPKSSSRGVGRQIVIWKART